MTDEKKPDALTDVMAGFGLLLRAAKTTVNRLPTERLERALADGAKEVQRAFVNVGETIEREILHREPGHEKPHQDPKDQAPTQAPKEATADAPPKEGNVDGRGPRVSSDDSKQS